MTALLPPEQRSAQGNPRQPEFLGAELLGGVWRAPHELGVSAGSSSISAAVSGGERGRLRPRQGSPGMEQPEHPRPEPPTLPRAPPAAAGPVPRRGRASPGHPRPPGSPSVGAQRPRTGKITHL